MVAPVGIAWIGIWSRRQESRSSGSPTSLRVEPGSAREIEPDHVLGPGAAVDFGGMGDDIEAQAGHAFTDAHVWPVLRATDGHRRDRVPTRLRGTKT